MLIADRKAALKAGYKAALLTPEIKKTTGHKTFKGFKKALKDWFVFGVQKKEKIIGMGILRDGEIHFCIHPKYQGRWLTRGLLKQINCLPITRTSVDIDNTQKQRFVEKIGFKPVEKSNGLIIYELNKLKYG